MGVSPLTPLGHQAGSGQPVPLCSQGLRCRRPSSDLFPTRRLSTKVFPPSPYPRLSSPTYPTSFKRALLPTQSSFDPSLQPPTRCLSRLHVFMNSGVPTQVFHKSKTSPENQEE